MEFSFNDHEKFISHFMLSNIDTAKAIAETPEWKNGMKTSAKMTVNGVEISFEIVEAFYQSVYDRTIKEAEARFSDLNKEAHRLAEEILKEQANKVREKLFDFEQQLNDISSILTPWYEKK